jgi:hypothetical protein
MGSICDKMENKYLDISENDMDESAESANIDIEDMQGKLLNSKKVGV